MQIILDGEDNIDILTDIIVEQSKINHNIYWYISDVDLSAKYSGDYSAVGITEEFDLVYDFMCKMRDSKCLLLKPEELLNLLKKVENINYGVFICFDNNVIVDSDYIVMIGDELCELPYHCSSICEVRIFEKDIIDIFKRRK